MMKEQLKLAGLTENESNIYLTLLNLGPSKAGEITRRSGLHRRVVYDAIEMLAQKGLLSYITKNNVKLFQPADPKTVLELLKEKQDKIEEIMPRLKDLFTKTHESEGASFYTGRAGLKTVMEDQIETKKEILIIGASPLAYDILMYYFKWFDKRRAKDKTKVKILFNQSPKKINIPYSEIRFLPQKYSSPLAVNIYGDRVALILWSKENPLAIVVKNKEISEGYKKYFELMWKTARK